MQLFHLTAIAWCANMMLDRREQAPFTLEDIYQAADRGGLVGLMLKIDASSIIEATARRPAVRGEIERALQDAAQALRGRELRKAGVSDNPLCIVIAVVLEALQQNFMEI